MPATGPNPQTQLDRLQLIYQWSGGRDVRSFPTCRHAQTTMRPCGDE
jgi:hypothetical protein